MPLGFFQKKGQTNNKICLQISLEHSPCLYDELQKIQWPKTFLNRVPYQETTEPGERSKEVL